MEETIDRHQRRQERQGRGRGPCEAVGRNMAALGTWPYAAAMQIVPELGEAAE